jgi:diaminopropionate ammonia-lyase
VAGLRADAARRAPRLARCLALGSIHYKDEGGRFGLGSFKALGGAYAVYRLLAAAVREATAESPSAAELAAGRHRAITAPLTVCCATDGNHGRSVAWGAQVFGCRCVIYVHATVSEGRVAAIARYGAEVIRVPGGYDDTVRRASRDAEVNGWTVVSDTSWEGYTEIPRDVMHGYTVMADEALRQLPEGRAPTHVFVQGGVGGVAAAVLARLWWDGGAERPRLVVVEPERAACLLESAAAGRRVALEGDLHTVMAGLECGETSLLAFNLLERGADAFAAIADDDALEMMRVLSRGGDGDPPVVAGESAVAGLVAAAELSARPGLAATLGLGAESRVLVFGTEGDTDPELYRMILGRSAAEVRTA